MHEPSSTDRISKEEAPGTATVRAADAGGLSPDPSAPPEKRPALLPETRENLQRFRAGGLEVELEFSEGGPTLQEAVEAFLLRQKSG